MGNSKKFPLIVYVHVPKTAGSTINKYMHQFSASGVAHCENIINIPEKLKYAATKYKWISGHVPLSQFEKNLGESCDRSIKYFTSVRNPVAQIASHYNWLIEIFHRSSDFYNNHPDNIKAISETIRRTDNSKPKEIIKNLTRFSGLFLNFQSRLVLGGDFNGNKECMNERLSVYTFISSSKNIPDLLDKMTGTMPSITPRENVSTYHFNKEVFLTKELSAFLLERNALDFALYQAVEDRNTLGGI